MESNDLDNRGLTSGLLRWVRSGARDEACAGDDDRDAVVHTTRWESHQGASIQHPQTQNPADAPVRAHHARASIRRAASCRPLTEDGRASEAPAHRTDDACDADRPASRPAHPCHLAFRYRSVSVSLMVVAQVGAERFEAPEALFQPRLVDVDGKGLGELVFQCIHTADMDLRPEFYKHIVLSGGSTMYATLLWKLSLLALANLVH